MPLQSVPIAGPMSLSDLVPGLVPISAYPAFLQALKNKIADTIKATGRSLCSQYRDLEEDSIDLTSLLDEYPVFVAKHLVDRWASRKSPSVAFFKPLPSIYVLTKDQLRRHHLAYDTCMEHTDTEPRPSQRSPDTKQAGIGIGSMANKFTSSELRLKEYTKMGDDVPVKVKKMHDEKAEMTHIGVMVAIELPSEIEERIILRALIKAIEATLSYEAKTIPDNALKPGLSNLSGFRESEKPDFDPTNTHNPLHEGWRFTGNNEHLTQGEMVSPLSLSLIFVSLPH